MGVLFNAWKLQVNDHASVGLVDSVVIYSFNWNHTQMNIWYLPVQLKFTQRYHSVDLLLYMLSHYQLMRSVVYTESRWGARGPLQSSFQVL